MPFVIIKFLFVSFNNNSGEHAMVWSIRFMQLYICGVVLFLGVFSTAHAVILKDIPVERKTSVNGITFAFSNQNSITGMHCVNTKVPKSSMAWAWNDNYFCTSKPIGLQWSHAGAIQGKTCTLVNEPDDSPAWDNNYICFDKEINAAMAALRFTWSFITPANKKNTVRWHDQGVIFADNYLTISITIPITAPTAKLSATGPGRGNIGSTRPCTAYHAADSHGECLQPAESIRFFRAPKLKNGAGDFYYTVSRNNARIGYVVYQGQTEPIKSDGFKFEPKTMEILECGAEEGFVPQQHYKNYKKQYGVTGNDQLNSPCDVGRKIQYVWHHERQLGNWGFLYSRNEDGDIQCLSFNAHDCTKIKYNQLSKQMDCSYMDNKSCEQIMTINEDYDLLAVVKPLVCGVHHKKKFNVTGYDDNTHWCTRAGRAASSYTEVSMPQNIGDTERHINRLFDVLQKEQQDKANAEVDVTLNYTSRKNRLDSDISGLKTRLNKYQDAVDKCYERPTFGPPLRNPCKYEEERVSKTSGQLKSERKILADLENEKTATYNSLIAFVLEGKKIEKHHLHELWNFGHKSRYATLIQQESVQLNELKSQQKDFEKTSVALKKQIKQEIQQYLNDQKSKGLLDFLELGAKNVLSFVEDTAEDTATFIQHPSAGNLLNLAEEMPLVKESINIVESIEQTAEEIDTLVKFMEHVKTVGFGTAMEETVNSIVTTLGDDMVQALKTAGFWRAHNFRGRINEARTIHYENIAGLKLDPVAFDPLTDTGAYSTFFQKNVLAPKGFDYNLMQDPFQSVWNKNSHQLMQAAETSKHLSKMTAIFAHSFGKDYRTIHGYTAGSTETKNARVTAELWKLIADPVYASQRKAYWVGIKEIGRRRAAFVYDDEDAVILLNRDMLKNTSDIPRFYFEELGHLANWWRCRSTSLLTKKNIKSHNCDVNGDAGARFRDAVFLNESVHKSGTSFKTLITSLPAHIESGGRATILFNDGKPRQMEGWGGFFMLANHLIYGTDSSILLRLPGVDITSGSPLSNEFDLEIVASPLTAALKDAPYKQASCTPTTANDCMCKTNEQNNCNIPTVWLTVGLRDAVGKPLTKKGYGALSGSLYRFHGVKLAFQAKDVNSNHYSFISDKNIYTKKMGVDGTFDYDMLGKISRGFSQGIKNQLAVKIAATIPDIGFTVNIPTWDNTAELVGFVTTDILANVAGCAGGAFLTDTITGCHLGSMTTEFIAGLGETFAKNTSTFLAAGFTIGLRVHYSHLPNLAETSAGNPNEPFEPLSIQQRINSTRQLAEKPFKERGFKFAKGAKLRIRASFVPVKVTIHSGKTTLPNTEVMP